jgi:LacI family transcriptional regulator
MPAPSNILLLIETSKAFGRKLLHGIGRYMADEGCNWAVYVEERGKRERLPAWIGRFDGDGVIAHSPSPAVVEALRSLDVPMVETDMCGMGLSVPMVYSDEDALVDVALEHFLARGLARVAWCQLVNRKWCAFRRDALIRQLQHRGLALEACYAPRRSRAMEWFDQRRGLIDWLWTLPDQTGVMCANDLCGTRLLEAARLAGVAVPEQIAVLGVDNDPVLCGMAWPPLSSVEQNADRIGYVSAQLLQQMLAGTPAPAKPVWVAPTGVVTRRSSDIIASDQPDLVAAVRYIAEHACLGISVHDVVRHVPVSRSQLEKLFRQHLGRSPKAEIQRVRLGRAKRLLEGNQSIAQVARRCGFTSSQYFSNVFQREVGATPSRWRQQHRGEDAFGEALRGTR